MEGTLAFERKHWEKAASALGDVKRIYHSLMPLVQSEADRSLYAQVGCGPVRPGPLHLPASLPASSPGHSPRAPLCLIEAAASCAILTF